LLHILGFSSNNLSFENIRIAYDRQTKNDSTRLEAQCGKVLRALADLRAAVEHITDPFFGTKAHRVFADSLLLFRFSVYIQNYGNFTLFHFSASL